MDEQTKAQQQYVIVNSDKHGVFPEELSIRCSNDLSKEHRSLQVNRDYLKSISGEGTLYDMDYHMCYLYVVLSAFSAGSGRYLEYSVQYAGADGFKGVLFDVVKKDTYTVLYSIFEAPKFGKNKKFKIHIPFDSDVDPRETSLRMRKLFNTKDYS